MAVLVPIWIGATGATLYQTLHSGGLSIPFAIRGAFRYDALPTVLNLWRDTPETAALRIGDRLARFGDNDLGGLSSLTATARAYDATEDGRLRVEVEREGSRRVVEVDLVEGRDWRIVPFLVAMGLTGLILLVRAPDWHLARTFFAASLSFPIAFATFWSAGGLWTVTNGVLRAAAGPVAMTTTLWATLGWPASRWPLAWPARVLPALLGLAAGVLGIAKGWFPGPFRVTLLSGLYDGLLAFFSVALLAGMLWARRHATPLERRQQKFVVYGFAVAIVPWTIGLVAETLGAPRDISDPIFALNSVALLAIPLGWLIAVVGYRYLDIDRLIGATATYTLLGIALLTALVLGVPRLAGALGGVLKLDPNVAQVVVAVATGAVVLPAGRALRRVIDRWLLPERFALEQGFHDLIEALGAAKGLKDLVRIAGEKLEALLRPSNAVCYARSADAYTPIYAFGRALPPAYRSDTALVALLRERRAPLAADRWARRKTALDPFDRAALEALDASVVLPIQRAGELVAFICLGAKRSGDVYTPSDRALLGAVAERCSEVIARLDAETLAREAQAMQSALRRYVPGAVAERVLKGDALEPAEREVSVLFVDIREYTQLAAGLRAADVFATLNEHTERVSRVVQECGGTVVEFNGDGLMAVFGAPEPLAKKEQQAVEAARRIVDSMPGALAVGVGVATGEAFVGSIRSTDRLIWSAVGSTTNLASRLQSMTRDLSASIAIDETTRERAGYVCTDFARHEGVAIRGRTGRFDVFALPLR